jgi:2-polyprenyl-3-methyl-5-hydroxy-6-metoxy-1,4-benzoquinol methylase
MSQREDADLETSSAGYARRFAGPVGAWFLERQARSTLELLTPWPGARILDVGGGHGQLTGPLLEAGHQVTVWQRRGVPGRVAGWVDAGQARFACGDLLHAPWPDQSFDVVPADCCPRDAGGRAGGELCRLARRP